jgi:hypothetical protein
MHLGSAVARAIIYQPLAMEAQVRFWASLCGIFGGQNGTGQVFLLVLLFSSVSIIPLVSQIALRQNLYGFLQIL